MVFFVVLGKHVPEKDIYIEKFFFFARYDERVHSPWGGKTCLTYLSRPPTILTLLLSLFILLKFLFIAEKNLIVVVASP